MEFCKTPKPQNPKTPLCRIASSYWDIWIPNIKLLRLSIVKNFEIIIRYGLRLLYYYTINLLTKQEHTKDNGFEESCTCDDRRIQWILWRLVKCLHRLIVRRFGWMHPKISQFESLKIWRHRDSIRCCRVRMCHRGCLSPTTKDHHQYCEEYSAWDGILDILEWSAWKPSLLGYICCFEWTWRIWRCLHNGCWQGLYFLSLP